MFRQVRTMQIRLRPKGRRLNFSTYAAGGVRVINIGPWCVTYIFED